MREEESPKSANSRNSELISIDDKDEIADPEQINGIVEEDISTNTPKGAIDIYHSPSTKKGYLSYGTGGRSGPLATKFSVLDRQLAEQENLKRDFWLQFSIMEKKMYLVATIALPILWFMTIFLPIFFIINCEEGHRWLAHILEGILALTLSVIDIVLSRQFRALVEDVTPPETLAAERLYKKGTYWEKILASKTNYFLFFEGLAILSYYDIYTDICFITIAYSSEDTIIWIITTIVMVITTAPRWFWYIYFQYYYYKIPRHPMANIRQTPDESGTQLFNQEDTEIMLQDRHRRLFNLLHFLRAEEMGGFAMPLRVFARNHKVFMAEEFDTDKKWAMRVLLWKSWTEDMPQLTCQFIYVLLVSDMCPQIEKVNPIILMSIVLSLFMSFAFTLLAIYNASKKQIYKATLMFEHTLDQQKFDGLRGNLPSDKALYYLAQVLPDIRSLQRLDLEGENIGDNGAKALGEGFKKAQHIRIVHLERNEIGSEGAEYLRKGIEVNRKIEHIDLGKENNLPKNGMTKLINFHKEKVYLTTKEGSDIELENTIADMYAVFKCLKRWSNPAVKTVIFDFPSPDDLRTSDFSLVELSSTAIINLLENGTNLKELEIIGTGFRYQQMSTIFRKINSAKKLERLDIMEVTLTPRDMHILHNELPYNQTLHTLTLASTKIGELGITELFRGLASNKSIQALNIRKNKFGDHAAEDIANALLANQKLEKIFLEENRMTDKGAQKIKEKIHATTSENFNFCIIDDEQVETYPLIFKSNSKRLREFSRSVQVKPKMFEIIVTFLKENEELYKISLSNKRFNWQQMEELCPILSQKRALTHLFLNDNGLDKHSITPLGQMARDTKTIEELRLNDNNLFVCSPEEEKDNKVFDLTIQLIQGALLNTTIKKLNLARNGIEKKVGKKIGAFLSSNTPLEELYLSDNAIGEVGVGAIGDGLALNTHLTLLDMANNNINEQGACTFANGLASNQHLKRLDLSNNKCKDIGINAIAKSLRKGKMPIVLLNFYENGFGRSGIGSLAKFLKQAEYLEEFNIGNNTIADEAVKDLAVGIKYDKSQSLKKINFSNTNPSMDHKGRDKISHKGGKLIEEAVTKHTQIIEMKLQGQNIPQSQIEIIENILEERKEKMDRKVELNRLKTLRIMKRQTSRGSHSKPQPPTSKFDD